MLAGSSPDGPGDLKNNHPNLTQQWLQYQFLATVSKQNLARLALEVELPIPTKLIVTALNGANLAAAWATSYGLRSIEFAELLAGAGLIVERGVSDPVDWEWTRRLIGELGQISSRLMPVQALYSLTLAASLMNRRWDDVIFASAHELFKAAKEIDPAMAHDLLASHYLRRFKSLKELNDLHESAALGQIAISYSEHKDRALFRDNQARRLDEIVFGTGASVAADAIMLAASALAETAASDEEYFFRLFRMSERAERMAASADRGSVRFAIASEWTLRAAQAGINFARSGTFEAAQIADDIDTLATKLFDLYRRNGSISDLHRSVDLGAWAVDTIPARGGVYPLVLDNQVIRLTARFEVLQDQTDLEHAWQLGNRLWHSVTETTPGRAAIYDHRATVLFHRSLALNSTSDLLEAIELGAHAITEGGASVDTPGFLSNQAQRLYARYVLEDDPSFLQEGLACASRAVETSPKDSFRRPLRQAVWAQLIMVRWRDVRFTKEIAHLREAAGLIDEALRGTPEDAPQRCERLATRLQVSVFLFASNVGELTEVDAICSELAVLLRKTTPPLSIFKFLSGNLRVLHRLARMGNLHWSTLADLGSSVLGALPAFLGSGNTDTRTSERDRQVLRAHAAVQGMIGLTAYALHCSSRTSELPDIIESALLRIADDFVARVPWDKARKAVPDLVARHEYLMTQARLSISADIDFANQVEMSLLGILDALGLRRETRSHRSSTRHRTVDCLWIVPGPESTLLVEQRAGRTSSKELTEVSDVHIGQWLEELQSSRSSTTPSRATRGQSTIPERSSVLRIVEEIEQMFGESIASTDDGMCWLIPLGGSAALPWQARHPMRRLNLSASLVADHSRAQETLPEIGRMIVYADPRGDLPGCRKEADVLAEKFQASVRIGESASIAGLASEVGIDVLHIACHGNPEPALEFSDGLLTLSDYQLLRDFAPRLNLLFLNACTSASALESVQDQTLGFASIALTAGARRVVVALWAVDDFWAGPFAISWYSAPNERAALAFAQSSTPNIVTRYAYQVLG